MGAPQLMGSPRPMLLLVFMGSQQPVGSSGSPQPEGSRQHMGWQPNGIAAVHGVAAAHGKVGVHGSQKPMGPSEFMGSPGRGSPATAGWERRS